MKNYHYNFFFFRTPLRSNIEFLKHGSLWNPIKKVIFNTKKVPLLLQAE